MMDGPTLYDVQRIAFSEARKEAAKAAVSLYAAFKTVEATVAMNTSLEKEEISTLLDLTDALFLLISQKRQKFNYNHCKSPF